MFNRHEDVIRPRLQNQATASRRPEHLVNNTSRHQNTPTDTRPQVTKTSQPLPPVLIELQKARNRAVKDYTEDPTQENKEFMQRLNRETKRQIPKFLRTGNVDTSTGMLATISIIMELEEPLENEDTVSSTSNAHQYEEPEIRPVENIMHSQSFSIYDSAWPPLPPPETNYQHAEEELETIARILQSCDIAGPSSSEAEVPGELPPALQELRRRKVIAWRAYDRFPSPENRRILRNLQGRIKRGVAEFRETGRFTKV